MKKYLEVLKKCALFKGIEYEDIDAVLACLGGKTVSVKKNEIIFAEGDEAKFFGIVLSGKVSISQNDFYGNRTILSIVGEGALFGESFAYAGVKEIPVSVMAQKDGEIMLVESSKLTKTCAANCAFHNKIILNLIGELAAKNIVLQRKVRIISKRTTREKLMEYLLSVGKERGRDFYIPYDRQALADYLCVDRSGLSSEIGKLKEMGVIECEKNRFKIL